MTHRPPPSPQSPLPPHQHPGEPDEKENTIERGWRWLKRHPKLVVLLVRIVPLLMLLFGFAVIVYIQLKAKGWFGGP